MNIAVIGTGMVGRLIAVELSKKYQVYAIDNNTNNLSKLDKYNNRIITKEMDIRNEPFLNSLEDAEIIINCVPGFMGFETSKKILEKKTCVDISFMPEDCNKLNKIAKKAETALYPDAGVAPGLSNIIVGNLTTKQKIDEIKIMVGGLPIEKKPPWNYKAPFSPIDVIEEYTRPARIKRNGIIETVRPLTGLINFEFENVGKLEAFLTDGLRTLLTTELTKNTSTLLEYTIRYPGHSKKISDLIENGKFDDTVKTINGKLTSQREITSKELFKEWKLAENDKEFTLLVITAKTREGDEISCIVYDEWRGGWSSMSRTTGLTACAITNLIIDKKLKKVGVITPEDLGTNQDYFDYIINYLKERKIIINFANEGNSLEIKETQSKQ
tara:strand:+ start:1127 stop:2278 length:1152 start_codon:yes stop_codon:yes gene_type:complete